ncbi:MAG: NAD-dependent epimerase/dehydratase family protein [Bryobacterales bacterium]|nr:NAD-dependent epimerase/dehydratase family protein [Bryobacterales bacterium]
MIPLILKAASPNPIPFSIFGTDHDTPDGTCVRDYVHVSDLADAHRRTLDHLATGNASMALNLGSGNGYSVRQLIEMAETVTGRPVARKEVPARPGDPARVIASNEKADPSWMESGELRFGTNRFHRVEMALFDE